jgi:hypothetical protein
MLLLAAMLIAMIPIGVAMLPSGVLASENQTVSGTFEVSDGDFNIAGVEVWSTVGTPEEVFSLAPTVDYHVKVTVYDANGLDTLDNVTVILFYESDNGTYDDGEEVGSDNVQTHATFQWTPGSGGVFEIVGPLTTTWACSDAGSSQPSLTTDNDTFEFHITVGEVATFAPASGTPKWFAYASATDPTGTEEGVSDPLTTQWFGSIALSGPDPSWAADIPGSDYRPDTVLVTYVSNGGFTKSAMAGGTWDRAAGPTDATLVNSDSPLANEFGLKADHLNVGASSAHILFTTPREIGTGAQTVEEPGTETNYLWLKLGTPFLQGTYTGTIYFQISNP